MKLFKKESKIEKEEYFSFRVEGIYEHKNDELFVLGIVDGIIQKLDSLFLIGPYGYEEKVEIQELFLRKFMKIFLTHTERKRCFLLGEYTNKDFK